MDGATDVLGSALGESLGSSDGSAEGVELGATETDGPCEGATETLG